MKFQTLCLTLFFMFFPLTIACNSGGGGSISNPSGVIAEKIDDLSTLLNKEPSEALADEMRTYMHNTLPVLLQCVGQIIVDADKIDDPKKRAEYLVKVQKDIKPKAEALMKVAETFEKKSKDLSPEERAKIEKKGQEMAMKWTQTFSDPSFSELKGLMQMF